MTSDYILSNRHDWQVAVRAVRKHENGEKLNAKDIAALKAISLEFSIQMFPQHSVWFRSLRDTD